MFNRWEDYTSPIRSSHPEIFLGKGALKICSKFTGEHPCQSVILLKSVSATLLKSHFRMGVLLYISYKFSEHFFYKNISGGPLLLFLKTAFKESINNGS